MIRTSRRSAEAAHRIVSRRALVIGGVQVAAVAVLGLRMRQMQLAEGEKYRLLAEENRVGFRLLRPDRGRILDRSGKVIAGNEANYRVSVVRETARDIERVLRDLSQLIPLTEEEIAATIASVGRVQSFVPVTVKDRMSWDDLAKVAINAPALPGINAEMAYSRVYPFGPDFAHQVGYVGPVNESELTEDAGAEPLLTLPDYELGKTGVERAHEAELRGAAGMRRVEVNASGRILRDLDEDPPVPGRDLQLGLDHHLQNFMRVRLEGQSAAAIVIDVSNGEVAGCVSAPSFDPNLFVRGISHTDYSGLRDDPYRPLSDKSVQGVYPPGSTIKMSIALAALQDGGVTPEESYFCPGYADISGRRFHCWKRQGHGRMTMRSALRESCDVYFYNVAQKVGIDNIYAMSDRLGLGRKFDLPLSGVAHGTNPSRQWKLERQGAEWLIGDTINVSIGQGYTLASPMQLAVMTARLASGMAIEPQLVRSGMQKPEEPPFATLGLDPAALALVRTGMFEVCNHERGTAFGSRIADPAMVLAGKTGTSQVFTISAEERAAGLRTQEELPWNRRDHALFVCYAPFDAPRYAVSVIVEHGGGGSTVAAPIARDIMLFALYGRLPPAEAYPAAQRARIATDLARFEERILPPDPVATAPDRA